MDFSPAVVGLIVGVPSFVLGMLGFRRAMKMDKSVESSAVIAAQTGQSGQVIDAWKAMVTAQSQQIDHLIRRVADGEVREEEREKRLSDCETSRTELHRELSRLQLDLAAGLARIAETGAERHEAQTPAPQQPGGNSRPDRTVAAGADQDQRGPGPGSGPAPPPQATP